MGILKLFSQALKTEKTTSISDLSKGKNPKIFDKNKERQLLSEYNKYKHSKDKSAVYYSALPLIDFYYKFRNSGDEYLNECEKYCNICLSCLSSAYMKPYLKDVAYVPVFKRLWIIYVNQNKYDKALEIADEALKYNQDIEYFNKQKEKIIKTQNMKLG